ncbi:MAG: hypothetical protein HQL56_16355 [Magnetococcales bacterium]|nr:hypothetical protein [Magnetococcales bacterium]
MATSRDRYTAEELARIRATLENSLGNDSSQALNNLDTRFTAAQAQQEESEEIKENKKLLGTEGAVNISEVIQEGQLEKMLAALTLVLSNPPDVQTLVGAILNHPEAKSFHLVDALSKVNADLQLLEALVDGIVTRKGINPLIDALKFSAASPKAMKSLAMAISEQGTVNHIMRAIASAPRPQPEAEIIWTMEIMGKGGVDQILEAMKLIDAQSPGAVVLATAIVNRQEARNEHLARSLTALKDNPKAAAILTTAVAKVADVPALRSLLEKYLKDDTEAAEIAAAKLVNKCLGAIGIRSRDMAEATKFARSPDSMTGQILAIGLLKQDNEDMLAAAFNRFGANVAARKIVANAIVKKKGKLMAFPIIGKEGFNLVGNPGEIQSLTNKATERLLHILTKVLGETPHDSFIKK